MADEVTDVSNREQLNLSIRWVNENYDVSEDPIGLFALPNTTVTEVIKGVATQIRDSNPAA